MKKTIAKLTFLELEGSEQQTNAHKAAEHDEIVAAKDAELEELKEDRDMWERCARYWWANRPPSDMHNDLLSREARRKDDVEPSAVYVVVKQGVYQHGAWGPLTSLGSARAVAQSLASSDEDEYHAWCIHSIDPETGLGDMLEAFSKSGDGFVACDAKGKPL